MGSRPNLPIRVPITIGPMLNFDGHCDSDGHGVGTCKQSLTFRKRIQRCLIPMKGHLLFTATIPVHYLTAQGRFHCSYVYNDNKCHQYLPRDTLGSFHTYNLSCEFDCVLNISFMWQWYSYRPSSSDSPNSESYKISAV